MTMLATLGARTLEIFRSFGHAAFFFFDLLRAMRTDYRIDDVQKTYFVIDSFEQLFEETRPDFTGYYHELKGMPLIGEGKLLPNDRAITV